MPNSVYSPIVGGSVQDSYYDQMATALSGDLYSPADFALVDSDVVSSAIGVTGLPAGVAVVVSNATGNSRPGINEKVVAFPTQSTDIISGITVRNQQMQSNVNGAACWFGGRMCSVLRTHRVGGRMWVKLASGTAVKGGLVYALTDGTGGITSVAGGNALIRGAAFASAGTGIVLVEFGVAQSTTFRTVLATGSIVSLGSLT